MSARRKCITYACVRFVDKKTQSFCVPITFVKVKDRQKQLQTFHPTEENDFDKSAIYFVKWKCRTKCEENHEHDGFYRAQIAFLAENKADVENRMETERLRYCSQQADITSSDYEVINSSSEMPKSPSQIQAITRSQEVQQIKKETCFMHQRENISDNMITCYTTQPNIPTDVLNKAKKSDVAGNNNRQDDFENINSDLDSDDSRNTSITYTHYNTTNKRVRKRLSHGMVQHSYNVYNDNAQIINKRVRRQIFKETEDNRQEENNNRQEDSNRQKGNNRQEDDNNRQEEYNNRQEEYRNRLEEDRNIQEENDNMREDLSSADESAFQELNTKQMKRRRIEQALNYKDSSQTYKRYDKISNTKIYLGQNISVGFLSWGMTKMARKPSVFLNNVLLHIWPENVLKNRCLDVNRTRYKPKDGTVKVLSPKKLCLALSLYNDYLMDLNISPEKRIKYLSDSFTIVCNKIRDVRKKFSVDEGTIETDKH